MIPKSSLQILLSSHKKTINSHELFSTFDAFFASLDDARAENQRRLAAAREAEKQIRITRERKERISTASKVRKSKYLKFLKYSINFFR